MSLRVTGVTFFDLAKPSSYCRKEQGRANSVPTPNPLVQLTVLALETPKITQISITEC